MIHANLPRFPFPPFPDSWYAVCWANEVKPAVSTPARVIGRDFVVFREADGSVRMLDAHCPHLGAHLGHGGTVVGGEVVCPFHGWRFAGDGSCTAAPGARKLPVGRPLRSWATREVHDRIWVWYSSDDSAPTWDLPDTLIDPDQEWPTAERLVRTFPSHPQDVIENAVDAAHFQYIHGMSEVWDSETSYTEHGLTTRLRVSTPTERFGIPGQKLSGTVTVSAYGMGLQTIHSIMRHERTGLDIHSLVTESVTPRERGEVTLLLGVHMRLSVPGVTWLAKRSFLKAVAFDVDADIQIWANRRYLDQPRLTASDGEIGRYRAWAKRFYPGAGARVTVE